MGHIPTSVILHLSMRASIQWHPTDLHKDKVLCSEKAGLSSSDIRQSRTQERQKGRLRVHDQASFEALKLRYSETQLPPTTDTKSRT